MSRTPTTRQLAFVTGITGLLLATGVLVALQPSVILEEIPELVSLLESIDPGLVLLLLLGLLVLFAPTLGIAGRLHADAPEPLIDEASSDDGRPPDEPTPMDGAPSTGLAPATGTRRDRTSHTQQFGSSLGALIDEATAYEATSRSQRELARETLIEELRPTAATAYSHRSGLAYQPALDAIERGTWTDDARAAAFLSTDEGRSLPVSVWIVDLLTSADPFTRSLDHVIEEIEAIHASPGASS